MARAFFSLWATERPLLGVEQEIPAWSLQAAGTGAWSGPGAGRGIAGVSMREEAGASPLTLALTLRTSENAHLGERHHWRRIGHDDIVPRSGDRRESLNRGDSASDPPAGFRVRRGYVSSVLWGGAGLWLLAMSPFEVTRGSRASPARFQGAEPASAARGDPCAPP